MCVFFLYPIPDSQQCVKRGSCRRLILSGLLCLFLFWASSPFVTSFELGPRTLLFCFFIESLSHFCTSCLFYFVFNCHLSLNWPSYLFSRLLVFHFKSLSRVYLFSSNRLMLSFYYSVFICLVIVVIYICIYLYHYFGFLMGPRLKAQGEAQFLSLILWAQFVPNAGLN